MESVTYDGSTVRQPQPAEIGDGKNPPAGWDEVIHEAGKRNHGIGTGHAKVCAGAWGHSTTRVRALFGLRGGA